MRDELDPIAGNWYRHLDKGQMFRVVGIDEGRDVIEIQYFDGDVEEIDVDAWSDMDLDVAEPPEDESGALDDEAREDGGFAETGMSRKDWREPLEGNRKASEEWEDETPEDERDDWDEDDDDEDLDYHEDE
jgi:hypothetical protein